MEELSHRKRARVDSAESHWDTDFEAKRIKEDLLSLLNDSELVPERDSVSQDLDSVIRSFEEEITGPGSPSSPANLIDLTSNSGDSMLELGQFSDDVLEKTETRVADGLMGIGEFWDFPSVLPGYDSFGLGIEYGQDHGISEYVALDGIFDYSDVNLGSDFKLRPETMPAI
ncbi:hypothetical protein SOVF_015980 [Spinacia oleracea]|uniref:Uncharacterized protein n=1 Tax=Spinacia oleracea TaxID=3562 RepID=A0A9R0I606_SPIOL|nr:uncharacterized protein LOC110783431 [Spinacia oleracea]KNA24409.1 hypothetical protein SOVF_015980 [Spinacia oleracea]